MPLRKEMYTQQNKHLGDCSLAFGGCCILVHQNVRADTWCIDDDDVVLIFTRSRWLMLLYKDLDWHAFFASAGPTNRWGVWHVRVQVSAYLNDRSSCNIDCSPDAGTWKSCLSLDLSAHPNSSDVGGRTLVTREGGPVDGQKCRGHWHSHLCALISRMHHSLPSPYR